MSELQADGLDQWKEHVFELYHTDDFPLDVNGLTYFALTDALIKYAGWAEQPLVYFWPSDPLIFLGMVDSKLPHLNDGLKVLEEAGYEYVVRNSGGLAVVSDPGVLNFSIIFPEEHQRLDINRAYSRMHELISQALAPYGVEVNAIEVPESYCPGDYDLSIHGRKIAGISQRRIGRGVAVMIYISMNGDQDVRSRLIKSFYDRGLQGKTINWDYPDIDPSVMTTVEAEIGEPIDVAKMTELIIQVLQDNAHGQALREGNFTHDILSTYMTAYDKMVMRNKKLLGSAFDKEAY